MGRLNFLHREHDVTPIGADRRREISYPQLENGLAKSGGPAQFRHGLIGRHRPRLANCQMELLGNLVQRDFARLADGGRNLVGLFGRQALRLFCQQGRQDSAAHLFKTLRPSVLVLHHLDDMEAILRLHQIGDGARSQRKGHLLELGNSLALQDPAQVAALVFAGVLGVLFGQFIELGAGALGLLQRLLGFLANLFDLRVGLADCLEKDVAGAHPVRNPVAVNRFVVGGPQLAIGHRDALLKLVCVQQRVADHAPLGHHVAPLVFLKIRGQIRFAHRYLGFQLVRLDHNVFDFDFFVASLELFAHLFRGHADSIGHQPPEFFFEQALTHQFFKLRHIHLEAVPHVGGVAFHAHEAVADKGGRKH